MPALALHAGNPVKLHTGDNLALSGNTGSDGGYGTTTTPAIVATASNAAGYLTTPTYDASGQAVHPAVYYNAAGWNGYRYWLAMCPYPNCDDTVENPSILTSDDGTTWAVPAGLTNPIDTAAAGHANSDDELLVDQAGKMWCYYQDYEEGVASKTMVRGSTDGVTWGAEELLITSAANGVASPAVLYDGTQYVMWYVDASVTPAVLKRRTCATPNGTWSAAITCTVNGIPAGKDLWHIDVVLRDGRYDAFIVVDDPGSLGVNTLLYFATSREGQTWHIPASPLLSPAGGSAWDATNIYRASALITAGGYDLFYAANKIVGGVWTWHIGRTPVTLS